MTKHACTNIFYQVLISHWAERLRLKEKRTNFPLETCETLTPPTGAMEKTLPGYALFSSLIKDAKKKIEFKNILNFIT